MVDGGGLDDKEVTRDPDQQKHNRDHRHTACVIRQEIPKATVEQVHSVLASLDGGDAPEDNQDAKEKFDSQEERTTTLRSGFESF
jgi:hypothetical protein